AGGVPIGRYFSGPPAVRPPVFGRARALSSSCAVTIRFNIAHAAGLVSVRGRPQPRVRTARLRPRRPDRSSSSPPGQSDGAGLTVADYARPGPGRVRAERTSELDSRSLRVQEKGRVAAAPGSHRSSSFWAPGPCVTPAPPDSALFHDLDRLDSDDPAGLDQSSRH